MRACKGPKEPESGVPYLLQMGSIGHDKIGQHKIRSLKQENGIIRLLLLKNLGCRVKNGLSELKRVKLKDTS